MLIGTPQKHLTEIVTTDHHELIVIIVYKQDILFLGLDRLRMVITPLNRLSHDRYQCILNFERLLHHLSVEVEQWL